MEALVARAALVVERDLVRLPSHDANKSRAAQGLAPLAERVARCFAEAGLAPPRAAEAQVALKCDGRELEQALDLLARGGTLVRIKDLLFHRDPLLGLRERLIAYLREHGQITAQQWKEMVGATRKFAIPLAEYFDAEKVTLRIGDLRKLRGK
jgi:selenocysteine-specific elongation factor